MKLILKYLRNHIIDKLQPASIITRITNDVAQVHENVVSGVK